MKRGWPAVVVLLVLLTIGGCGSSSDGDAIAKCADLFKAGAKMDPDVAHGDRPCIDKTTGKPTLQLLTSTTCGEEEHIWHQTDPDVWWSSADWVVHAGAPPACKS